MSNDKIKMIWMPSNWTIGAEFGFRGEMDEASYLAQRIADLASTGGDDIGPALKAVLEERRELMAKMGTVADTFRKRPVLRVKLWVGPIGFRLAIPLRKK